ncbi:MAG: hypothetical protein ACYC6Y_21245 [Thermoguttaceae bacterium]
MKRNGFWQVLGAGSLLVVVVGVVYVEKLTLHAQTEEQVLYPAALLVGEYLKTKVSQ